MSITIKSRLGKGEIRRSTTKVGSYEELKAHLVRSHGLDAMPRYKDGFSIKYEDDEGDRITLSTDADLEEAKRVAKSTGDVMRLTVLSAKGHEGRKGGRKGFAHRRHQRRQRESKEDEEEEREEEPAAQPQAEPQANVSSAEDVLGLLPQLVEKMSQGACAGMESLRPMLSKLLSSRHVSLLHNEQCAYCDGPICGVRHQCETCPEFSLCDECIVRLAEHEGGNHTFKSIQPMDAILDFLKKGGDPRAFLDAYVRRGRPEEDTVHHPAICDECDQSIVGIRRKCLECDDYDVCTPCFLAGKTHSHHELFEMSTHSQETRAAYDEARANLAPKEQEQRADDESESVMAAALEVAASAIDKANAAIRQSQQLVDQAITGVQERLVSTPEPEPQPVPAPVATPAPAPAPAPAAEAKSLNSFERNLQTLESMGFSDRENNIRVLVKHKNQLFGAIQQLLA